MLKLRWEGKLELDWKFPDKEDITKTALEWAGYGWPPGLKLR